MAVLLDYQHVEISFNGNAVVHDVSFQLHPGEILGLVGESGAGKTTLIKAAMDLLGESGMVTRGDIWFEGKNLPDRYAITVRDEGRGMTAESLAKITEAFFMVDKSRSRKEGGAGLGMTLCNQSVKLHGARWDMKSEPDAGTSMTVIFSKEVG